MSALDAGLKYASGEKIAIIDADLQDPPKMIIKMYKKSLEGFWRKIIGVPYQQFYPTYIDQRTVGKKTLKKGYKGVCVLLYFDTSIQLELELLADSVIKFLTAGR